jgi:hypothetical protein
MVVVETHFSATTQATLWISGEWKRASRKSRGCLLRIMVSWIVFRAEVFKSKRSERRHLRHILTGFRPVEMGRIARQGDDASGRICLQLFRIELVSQTDVENAGDYRIDAILIV